MFSLRNACARRESAGISFFRGIMKSSNRLNYDESAVLMEEASSPMGLLASLARDFRQKRKDCGGLIIERPEQKIKINGGISCQTVKRNIAHLAIEECMIAANRCAADFIIRERRSALHRIHKKPSPESVDKLCRLLAELGIVFPRTLRGKILPRRLPPLIKNPPHWETRCCRSSWNAGTRLLRAGYHIRALWFGLSALYALYFAHSPLSRFAYTTRFNCGLGKKRTAHRRFHCRRWRALLRTRSKSR